MYHRPAPVPLRLTPDEIEARPRRAPRRAAPVRGRAAAVLVPLVERAGETCVVLTKRASSLRKHAGQYAFPGGRRDEGDRDAVATALREAEEEVGLAPADVRVLGLLDDYLTTSGYLVTPVVGAAPHPYDWRPSPDEVERVVVLPLEAFVTPQRARTLLFEGFRRIVMAFDVEGHFVWGATASMLRDLARRLREP